MPALKPTEFMGRVVWLGVNQDRAAALESTSRDVLSLPFGGPPEESHSGVTRRSCSRVSRQYPKGTEIANTRQVSIVSEEDLALIAQDMGLARIEPEWLGVSMVVAGIPDFSLIPPSSRLQDDASGTTLVVDMENRPCHLVSAVIERGYPGIGKRFKPAARNRRGVTAWVERPGEIALGATLRLHIPDQPVWPHLATARNG
ncbi:sulfurase [Roseibacterium beibuensis]|uniref:MOSC domain-containing protein n=1 Tax=[Roseibacterium] beibuensis TaxID=1193142 RepID=A0ABP9KVT5_9RHOB|nr:sulfurase [Roseibacterium beibuensis]MCS6622304.1 sulfurase [Roseibacterium beibuensis]